MKCVTNNQVVKRLEDSEAETLIAKKGALGWKYCTKAEWRKYRTPTPEVTPQVTPQVTPEVTPQVATQIPEGSEAAKILQKKVRKHKKSTEVK